MVQSLELPKKNIQREQHSPRPRKKLKMDVDWSELPKELLVKIIEDHLVLLDDFTMISCVCRAWYQGAAACNLVKLRGKWSHCQIPWLVLPDSNSETISGDVEVDHYAPEASDDGADDDGDDLEECVEMAKSEPDKLYRKKLWDVKKSKFYSISCPRGYGEVCWGSSYGWIVTACLLNQEMYMFNPLTKSKLSLPSPTTFPHLNNEFDISKCFINKVVVLKVPKGAFASGGCSNDNEPETLLLVAMYGYDQEIEGLGHVAIASAGDTRWRGLEWSPSSNNKPDVEDVIYQKDLGLLFVCKRGGLAYCNLWDKRQSPLLKWYKLRDKKTRLLIRTFKPEKLAVSKSYLATYGNDIFLVQRHVFLRGALASSKVKFTRDYWTGLLHLFVLNVHNKRWKTIYELPQDLAIFVGDNATMAVNARDVGCQGNSLYFADDGRRYITLPKGKGRFYDAGVKCFKLPNVKYKLFPPILHHKARRCCSPFWFRPSR